MYDAIVDGEDKYPLYVFKDDTTFKGVYLCNSNKNFDTRSGDHRYYDNYEFDNKSQLLIGVTSYITNNQKHHNLEFMFASRI